MFGSIPTKEEAFESAVIDGINTYVRTVLVDRGFLSREAFDRTCTLETVQACASNCT